MSEYQYYEWLAIDRPLTEKELDEVNGLSSHMDVVTATGAVVTYEWGDFKHDPRKVMLKYFDAMLYAANWGSRRLAFRFPAAAVDADAIQVYCDEEHVTLTREGKFQVLDIDLSPEESSGEWVDADRMLGRLVPLREQIMEGDYRALYLAWLKAQEMWGWIDVEDEEMDEAGTDGESESAPPVPAGLRKLTSGLKTFMEFFDIDPHLVKAASESSAEPEQVPDQALAGALTRLPRAECDAFLLRVLQNEPQVGRDLRRRLIELAGIDKPAAPPRSHSVAALAQAAKGYEEAERRREEAAAERQRIQELKELSGRAETTWTWVERLIEQKQAKPYDEAVALLVKLRDVATWENRLPEFEKRFSALAGRYTSRPSLMERLRRAGLMV
jgi:hypothetical protein